MRAEAHLRTEFPRIILPLLILHSAADKAAKADRGEFSYDTAGAEDKTLTLYEGAFHDLDTAREAVMADIKNWLISR